VFRPARTGEERAAHVAGVADPGPAVHDRTPGVDDPGYSMRDRTTGVGDPGYNGSRQL